MSHLPDIVLDNRSFQDLVSEARLRIARSCPEWTEHNVSDPGVTLIELFAWMTEMLVYRVNRLPDKVHVALLELLGVQLDPPSAATTFVRFRLAAPAQQPVYIPARETEVATLRTASDDPLVYEVRDDFTIAPIRPVAYVLRRGGRVEDVGVGDGEARPQGPDRLAFGTPPQPGDALHLGFAEPLGRLVVEVAVEASPARGAGVDPDDPPLRWEVSQGDGSWAAAEVLADTTGGFNYGSGRIELQLPRRSGIIGLGGHRRYWLRCRLAEADAEDGADGDATTYTHPPEVFGITARAIGAMLPAVHASTERFEVLGQSDGSPGQAFELRQRPVLPLDGQAETLEVRTAESTDWVPWERVESFASSGPDDLHFTFDPAVGRVELGPAIRASHDGWAQHGAIPRKGATLRMRAYRHGGGHRGNVAAGAITVLRTSIPGVATVSNPVPAHGGVDVEALDEARRRASLELRTRYRAVTAEDFEFLAGEASPRVARAICLEDDAGGVSVHVLPHVTAPDGPIGLRELVPDAGLLADVARYLDGRRVLGTSVLVKPVPLRAVSVVAHVQAGPLADPGRIELDVLAALTRYINPLVGGSPDGGGEGWQFGRALTEGELHGIVQAVDGVEAVTLLRIYEADPRTGRPSPQPADARLELRPAEVAVSAAHQVKATRRHRT